ncbi:MAG TPA: exodeoxyribonuclease III [Burkholderiales bacterium]|nr:exodeoxyribonuclease III [Burkholderiales bacterium]
MKLAAWNVNSLKVRLPHLLEWLARERPDAVCLQETKIEDAKFSLEAIEQAGYRVAFSGQKTYNGVAILAREAPRAVEAGISGYVDQQKRVLSATVGDLRLVCAYVPNGQSLESDKYRYKLEWLAAFDLWLEAELKKYPRLAVLGDFNIAPEDRDVHDPNAWEGQVLVSAPERAAFQRLLGRGLTDSFRLFEQPEKSYSWWDYRMNAFKRDRGLRIDHILVSPEVASRCRSSSIHVDMRKLERPSDHAPVVAEIA